MPSPCHHWQGEDRTIVEVISIIELVHKFIIIHLLRIAPHIHISSLTYRNKYNPSKHWKRHSVEQQQTSTMTECREYFLQPFCMLLWPPELTKPHSCHHSKLMASVILILLHSSLPNLYTLTSSVTTRNHRPNHWINTIFNQRELCYLVQGEKRLLWLI